MEDEEIRHPQKFDQPTHGDQEPLHGHICAGSIQGIPTQTIQHGSWIRMAHGERRAKHSNIFFVNIKEQTFTIFFFLISNIILYFDIN